ncbi:MAG TPA: VWA domain-containing protein [Pyrinomonadaceae bacterium]|jgi:Ca-activated chloride channel family protein
MKSKKTHLFITIFLSTFVFAFSAFAQTPQSTPPPADGDEVIKVNSRLVVVPVSVTDANGQPMTGLTAQDFRVTEEGKPQQIETVSTAEKVPLEIVLLFDVSASTDAMFEFEQETAAKFLQQVMRPEDRATIFTVGERPILIQGRETAEKSAVAVKLVKPTKQQTAFYDSVTAASNYLQKNAPQGRRKVIVIISDGEDTNSEGIVKSIWNAERKLTDSVQGQELRAIRVKARDAAKTAEQTKVVKSLQNADTVFYSINPAGSSYQLNKISQFGQSNMQKFADETGGTAFLPKFAPIDLKDNLQNSSNLRKNQEMLTRIFQQLANELQAQYLVQYYSEAEFPNNRYVKLDVGLQNPRNLRVRARQGYFAKN